MIFWFYNGVKVIYTQKPYIEFWILIFSHLAIYGMILSRGPGQPQWATAPRQPWDHEDEQLILTQPFCFSQYSINYVSYSTPYYKTGFVLDDFAQQ